jgi:hypothetical protein
MPDEKDIELEQPSTTKVLTVKVEDPNGDSTPGAPIQVQLISSDGKILTITIAE